MFHRYSVVNIFRYVRLCNLMCNNMWNYILTCFNNDIHLLPACSQIHRIHLSDGKKFNIFRVSHGYLPTVTITNFQLTRRMVEAKSLSPYFLRHLHGKNDGIKKEKSEKPVSPKKSSTADSPHIYVIDTNDDMTHMTLTQAESLAKRRDLKLIKLDPSTLKAKYENPVYKLLTGKEFIEEELEHRKSVKEKQSSVKGEKILRLNANIGQSDLDVKLHNIRKWIDHRFQVNVVIEGGHSSRAEMEKLHKLLEEEAKAFQGRVLQVRKKEGSIHFHIVPPKLQT